MGDVVEEVEGGGGGAVAGTWLRAGRVLGGGHGVACVFVDLTLGDEESGE